MPPIGEMLPARRDTCSGKITNNDHIGLPDPTAANFINSPFRLSPEKQEAADQTNDGISGPGRGFQQCASHT